MIVNNTYLINFTDTFYDYGFNGMLTDNISAQFCTNIPSTLDTYIWKLFGSFTLRKPNYVTRILTIPENPGNIVSNNPQKDMPLFMIPINDSSTITFTWQTTEFQFIDGTMIIYKCNPDGTRSIVEIIPIVGGEAVANLQLLISAYSYEVIIDGTTYTLDPGWTTCHVESSTTRSFFVDISEVNVLPTIGLFLVDCSLTQTGNNTVRMRWNANSENPTNITGCIIGNRDTSNGIIQTYRNCTTGTTGDFVRNISNNTGSYYVVGELTQDGVIGYCRDTITFTVGQVAASEMGGLALFGVILLIMSLSLIYSDKQELMLVAGGLGLIVSFVIGWLLLSWQIVLGMLFFLAIIVAIGRYGRKR